MAGTSTLGLYLFLASEGGAEDEEETTQRGELDAAQREEQAKLKRLEFEKQDANDVDEVKKMLIEDL